MILSLVFLPLLWWSNRSYSAERLIDWSPRHSHSILINKLGNYEQESTVQWVKLAGKLASEGEWGQDSQCLVRVVQVLASATLINEDVHVMNWRVQAGREGQNTGEEGQNLKLQWYWVGTCSVSLRSDFYYLFLWRKVDEVGGMVS